MNIIRTHCPQGSGPWHFQPWRTYTGFGVACRPGGFWYAINDSWRKFCHETFHRHYFWDLDQLHEVVLTPANRILLIDSESDAIEFNDHYCYIGFGGDGLIDWSQVRAAGWQGVEFQWYDLDALSAFWWKSLDVASGCVWDLSAIQDVRRIDAGVLNTNTKEFCPWNVILELDVHSA